MSISAAEPYDDHCSCVNPENTVPQILETYEKSKQWQEERALVEAAEGQVVLGAVALVARRIEIEHYGACLPGSLADSVDDEGLQLLLPRDDCPARLGVQADTLVELLQEDETSSEL